MIRKAVYPYEYIDSFEQFQQPQLPPEDAFYGSLTEKYIFEMLPKGCLKTSTRQTLEIIRTSIC